MTRLLQYLKKVTVNGVSYPVWGMTRFSFDNGEVVIGYENGDEHILKATSSQVVLEFRDGNGAGESAEDIARETVNGVVAEIA